MASWSLADAEEKVQQYIDETPVDSIEVLPWTRELDLSNLTDKKCRVIEAAHLYIDLVGIENQLPDSPTDDDLKTMVQAMHVFTRVAIDAIEVKLTKPGRKVQFQGLRTHAIFFKPYSDAVKMCHNAVAALCYMRLVVRNHFAPKFSEYPNIKLYAGLDWGPALATSIGTGEDREPLFIGDAANRPAKTLARSARKPLSLAEGAYEQLSGGVLDVFIDHDAKTLDVSSESKVLEALGLSDDVSDLAEVLDNTIESYPLERISISKLRAELDWSVLDPLNNRRVEATTIFADLSGFTRFVEAHMQDFETLREAVQILHVTRREFNRVASKLYGFQRVAYQGDRLQAFRRNALEPSSDAIESCIAFRDSLKEVIHKKLEASEELGISTGAASGEIILSRVGKRGNRENACLGRSARLAAQVEELLEPQVVGITTAVRDVLPDSAKRLFNFSPSYSSFINEATTVEEFKAALSEESEKVEKSETRQAQLIERSEVAGQVARFNVSHRQQPLWSMDLRGVVTLSVTAATNGFRPKEIRSESGPVPKHWSLRFEASTNIARPYKIFWQVVNTGSEAVTARCLRGEFLEGVVERGGHVRNESTLYTGMHWVECFIVKNGVCVARSGEFVVNIS